MQLEPPVRFYRKIREKVDINIRYIQIINLLFSSFFLCPHLSLSFFGFPKEAVYWRGRRNIQVISGIPGLQRRRPTRQQIRTFNSKTNQNWMIGTIIFKHDLPENTHFKSTFYTIRTPYWFRLARIAYLQDECLQQSDSQVWKIKSGHPESNQVPAARSFLQSHALQIASLRT